MAAFNRSEFLNEGNLAEIQNLSAETFENIANTPGIAQKGPYECGIDFKTIIMAVSGSPICARTRKQQASA